VIQVRKDRTITVYEIIISNNRSINSLLCFVTENEHGTNISAHNLHGKFIRNKTAIDKVKDIINNLDILNNMDYNKFYKVDY
jgi:hypothetical protein